MSEPTKLLTVRAASLLLGVSPKRVYQYLEEGRLSACRLGPRQIRIPRTCLEDFVRAALSAERRRLGIADPNDQ
jgi:excisionase family DNA binding protein